jgi:hypothetical protein
MVVKIGESVYVCPRVYSMSDLGRMFRVVECFMSVHHVLSNRLVLFKLSFESFEFCTSSFCPYVSVIFVQGFLKSVHVGRFC